MPGAIGAAAQGAAAVVRAAALASAEDTAKAIDGVLAALAQGLVTLGEAGEAIELIERCRRIIGPAPPASL